MLPANARQLALDVLAGRGPGFARERLDAAFRQTPLSPAERGLATQLVYGVLRRRGSLDALLRPLIDRPAHQVEPWLTEVLRLGAYQLTFLTHVPPHAAINETVELATFADAPRAKGFLNGVLRELTRLLTDERVTAPAVDALPLEAGVYRRLTRPIFPDPATDPVGYLSAGWSLPPWLAERWVGRDGVDEAARLGAWFVGPAPLWLRVNPLKIDRDALRAALAAAGFQSEPGEHPQALQLTESAPIRELPGYADGWFTVQDASAMAVASAVDPKPGWTVLDACAAPGGKASHLAELMGDRGRVIACDSDAGRLSSVSNLCHRLKLSSVEPLAVRDEPPAGPFDAALVDVPCSNTGVLGRRPEVRWRLSPDEFRHLIPLQTKLLLRVAERVKPGGVVVYSTCSVEPTENADVVRAVLRVVRGLHLEAEHTSRPGLPADGGYWARLRRR